MRLDALTNRYPHPHKPGVFVSRQYLCQLRKLAAGCCICCGAPRRLYARECDACRVKRRNLQRRRRGSQPWRAGSRGRPPRDRTVS